MIEQYGVVLKALLTVGMTAGVVWVIAETMRLLAAPATRPRWLLAGVERATRYPAGMWLSGSAVIDLSEGRYFDFLMSAIATAVWLFALWEKHRDGNDDDFWPQVGGWFRRVLSAGRVAPQGASRSALGSAVGAAMDRRVHAVCSPEGSQLPRPDGRGPTRSIGSYWSPVATSVA